jgi:branched-chain amino acid transport system substrate-binding protein
MKQANPPIPRRTLLQAGLGAGSLLLAGRPAHAQAQAQKPAEIKVGIATFLSGPSSVFGVPGRQGAADLRR